MEGRGKKAEATRARLLRVSRDLFAKRGYADVGTEEIVRRAKVTRGALYHHFRDKQDLFRAVHEQLEAELVESLGARIAGIEDAGEMLATGLRSFLDACTDPALAQISLLDAPSVLGWAEWRGGGAPPGLGVLRGGGRGGGEWREVDARYGMGLVRLGLEAAMEQGVMPRQDPEPLAHLLLAALGEAALLIAHADDPQAARREVEAPLMAVLEGLQRS